MRNLVFLLGLAAVGVGCDLDANDCADAKRHLCDNLLGQACSTATMANAVNKVRDACGDAAATTFIGEAEAYCAAESATFDAEHCSNL